MTKLEIAKWARLHGETRTVFQDECVQMYETHRMSLRQIAQETGRSYGSIHALLLDAGVRLRPRGNPHRLGS